jgi:hypothetical protein
VVLRALSGCVLAAAVALAACGGDDDRDPGATQTARALTWTLPAGWHAGGRLTRLGGPSEALAAGSFRLRPGGACGPERAREDMPRDGALVWMVEYRRPSERLLRSLPARPVRFRLPGAAQPYECAGVGWNLSFRDHGRALQAFVALGPRAGAARRAQALALLDSLKVGPAPSEPPDPYAGWRTRVNGVDSVRVPPGWSVRNGRRPRGHRPPRTLFTLRNGAGGEAAVALSILERRWGPPSPRFPAVRQGAPWFATWDRSGVARVERSGLEARGHRFEAVVVAGPGAAEADRAAARKAAGSLGVALWKVPANRRDG